MIHNGSPDYRTALITGASSGMGRALALALAREGTRVYVAARRRAELDALVDEIARDGGSAEALPLDVSDADHTHEVVSQLDARDPLDLVVANAGVGGATPAKRATWPQVKRILDVNVLGAIATLMAALPGMVARDRGHLVGMASLAGWRGLPKFNAYCASKAALLTFLESTRVDLRAANVAVTAVCPGFVKTEMTAHFKKPPPFFVNLDDAVKEIRRSLARKDAVCAFPKPSAAAMRAVSNLPDSVYDFLVTRARVPY
jgi:short-subunit dehydrogenase